jgi:hypothetical protein
VRGGVCLRAPAGAGEGGGGGAEVAGVGSVRGAGRASRRRQPAFFAVYPSAESRPP